ncbi:sulfonate transport system substrate-binding protein [Shouchella rhizosphaerae]|nr:aliphatic sulfonate ABC transporter substrate-binding protein [Shouchella clausii]SHL76803.1 sulfonate transport system substrate-binding protein [Shouchella rhizosphaerae]
MRKMAVFGLSFGVAVVLAACNDPGAAAEKGETVTIGYQKGALTLSLKEDEAFARTMADLGYSLEWAEFNTGSSTLEALGSGSTDLANAGDTPSIYAIANRQPIDYIAATDNAPYSEGILVRPDSGIDRVEDLDGKRIAFNRASISQYLLYKALDSVGLTFADIEPVYLGPADANLAFEQGNVDAWVTWDPYLAVSEEKGNHIIATADGLASYRSFYFANSDFADQHPEAVLAYVEALQRVGTTIESDASEAAAIMEKATGLPQDTWIGILNRLDHVPDFIDEEAVFDLQEQADDLMAIGLLEDEVSIVDYVWDREEESE